MEESEFRLKDKAYNCYFELTLDLIGGKWKPIILYKVGVNEVLRYAEIRRSIPKITERMLSKQLKELEADMLLSRKVYPVIPPKVEYRLTEKGLSLLPILGHLKIWGEDFFENNKELFAIENMELEA